VRISTRCPSTDYHYQVAKVNGFATGSGRVIEVTRLSTFAREWRSTLPLSFFLLYLPLLNCYPFTPLLGHDMPGHRSLADLASRVPSTNPSRVLDSASEGEDEDDQPRPIASSSTRILNEVMNNGSTTTPRGSNHRGSPALRGSAAKARVSASMGRGGRMEYTVQKSDVDIKYYSVQWSVERK
jgi:hypothetical protein